MPSTFIGWYSLLDHQRIFKSFVRHLDAFTWSQNLGKLPHRTASSQAKIACQTCMLDQGPRPKHAGLLATFKALDPCDAVSLDDWAVLSPSKEQRAHPATSTRGHSESRVLSNLPFGKQVCADSRSRLPTIRSFSVTRPSLSLSMHFSTCAFQQKQSWTPDKSHRRHLGQSSIHAGFTI
jgi:hypothetical protein